MDEFGDFYCTQWEKLRNRSPDVHIKNLDLPHVSSARMSEKTRVNRMYMYGNILSPCRVRQSGC